MVYYITYDCSNKDADKKGLSFFRLPKDHKLRLTWFKKLRLVDPPNTDNVRVRSEHFTEECFIVDMQAAMGFNLFLFSTFCSSFGKHYWDSLLFERQYNIIIWHSIFHQSSFCLLDPIAACISTMKQKSV